MKAAAFHYSADGTLLVLGDGPELYVFSGRTDTGIWKQMCDGIVIGVAAGDGRVSAVDTDGRLQVYRAIDGSRQADVRFDRPCHGLVVAGDGRLAMLVDEAVIVCSAMGENAVTFPAPGVRSVAFGRDLIAIGSDHGTVHVIDLKTGKPLGQLRADGPIAAVAFRAPDEWCVVVRSQLQVWSKDLKKMEASVEVGGEARRIACSGDGALAAIALDREVRVFELYNTRAAATLGLDRDVNDVSFGPGHWLGLGLDDAEANRVEIVAGTLAKTEAFPGMTASKWPIRLERNEVALRTAVAHVRAGGKPIAQQVDHGGVGGGGGCGKVVAVLALLTALAMCCGGCGAFGYFYYFMYAPQ